MNKCIYVQNGFKNRGEYLHYLAESYGMEFITVVTIADMLGEEEDFDGLVSQLEDYEFFSR